MAKIVDIKGEGSVFTQKLQTAGISTVEVWLKTGTTSESSKELAAKSSTDHYKILYWVNFVDLYRIKGVG